MRPQVPKFVDYSGAIQANQSMMDGLSKLGSISQDYAKMEEQKKQNVFDNQYKTDVFAETKNQNTIANNNADRGFYYGVGRDNLSDIKADKEWTYKVGRDAVDDTWKTKVFDYGVTRDGVTDNHWNMDYRNKVANQNKPDFTSFNSIDAQGNPTLSLLDKNTGRVTNTGQQVYQAPKEISPEQKMYYMDKSEELKNKTLGSIKKSFMENPAYSKLSPDDQLKAIYEIETTGKAPQIAYTDGGYTGFEKYYLPMSEAVKQEKQKQLEQDMKTLGL